MAARSKHTLPGNVTLAQNTGERLSNRFHEFSVGYAARPEILIGVVYVVGYAAVANGGFPTTEAEIEHLAECITVGNSNISPRVSNFYFIFVLYYI